MDYSNVNPYNYNTVIPILKELDVPFICTEWEKIIQFRKENNMEITGQIVMRKYLVKMRLMSFKDFKFEDTKMWCRDERLRKRFCINCKHNNCGENIDQGKCELNNFYNINWAEIIKNSL